MFNVSPVGSVYELCQDDYNLIYKAQELILKIAIKIDTIHRYSYQDGHQLWSQLIPIQWANTLADRSIEDIRKHQTMSPLVKKI